MEKKHSRYARPITTVILLGTELHFLAGSDTTGEIDHSDGQPAKRYSFTDEEDFNLWADKSKDLDEQMQ